MFEECQYCRKNKEDVSERHDPFIQKLEGEDVEIQVCDDCYMERLYEV